MNTSTTIRFVMCLLIIVLFSVHSVHIENESKASLLPSDIEHAMSASTIDDVFNANKRIFSNAATLEVQELTKHPDNGIALSAAWQLVQRTMINGHFASQKDLTRDILLWFTGFVEGRLATNVPPFWKETILHVKQRKQMQMHYTKVTDTSIPLLWELHVQSPQLYFPRVPNTNPLQKNKTAEKDGTVGFITPGISAKLDGEFIKIDIDNTSIQIMQKQIPTKGIPIDVATAIADGDKAYLLLYSLRCNSYPVICIQCSTNKILWSNTVWVSTNKTRTGSGYHWSVMEVQGNNLIVFGIGDEVAYIEAFDTIAGSRLFFFSTEGSSGDSR